MKTYSYFYFKFKFNIELFILSQGNVPKIKENNQSITIIDSNHVHESYKNKSFAEDDNNLSSHFNENNSKDINNVNF